MLLSRAFALSCDKPGHGKDRRTAHCQPARRSRCRGFVRLARRGAVIQQDRGDPRRSERARGVESSAERPADRRSGPALASRRSDLPRCPTGRWFPRSFAIAPMVSPGVANGRPDVFGTVALRVGHTPLDARWHKVEHSPVGGTAARFAEALRGKDKVERLEAVNWYVNKRVRFVDDSGPVRPRRRLVAGQRSRSPAAAATARIMRSPSCRCCAAPEFADRDLYLVDRQGSGAPRRPCGARRPRRAATCTCSTTAPTGCSIARASATTARCSPSRRPAAGPTAIACNRRR